MNAHPNDAPCRLLHVEDSPDDAELVRLALARSPLADARITRVETEPDYVAALADPPDAIVCDYQMPRFGAERALAILRERGLDIPFIIVSHHIDGSGAIMALQRGASDYLSKRDLLRLPKAVGAALERGQARASWRRADEALRAAQATTRAVLDSLGARVAVLDAHGQVVATNRAWDAFAASGAPVAGSRAAAGDDYPQLLREAGDAFGRASHDALAAVLAGERKLATLEGQATIDGRVRPFAVRLVALDAPARGAVVTYEDAP